MSKKSDLVAKRIGISLSVFIHVALLIVIAQINAPWNIVLMVMMGLGIISQLPGWQDKWRNNE